jgi:hypothetical protein
MNQSLCKLNYGIKKKTENAFNLGALKEQELNEAHPHSLEAAFEGGHEAQRKCSSAVAVRQYARHSSQYRKYAPVTVNTMQFQEESRKTYLLQQDYEEIMFQVD